MGQDFHNASLMCNLPQRQLLKLGSLCPNQCELLCPKPFNTGRSWILVARGLVLEELDATAPSESERDWLEGKSETPQVRDYWRNR